MAGPDAVSPGIAIGGTFTDGIASGPACYGKGGASCDEADGKVMARGRKLPAKAAPAVARRAASRLGGKARTSGRSVRPSHASKALTAGAA
jgi:hypothetical protein